MLQYQPSIICASAVYLALKTHGQTPWVRTACALSGAFASLPAPFPPPPRLSPSHTHYPPTSPLPCLPAPPCLRAFHVLSLFLRPTWCGAGAADLCASEAFELHGGRPSGLCPSPSANPNPNPNSSPLRTLLTLHRYSRACAIYTTSMWERGSTACRPCARSTLNQNSASSATSHL